MFNRARRWLARKIAPKPQSSQTGTFGYGRSFEAARFDPDNPNWQPPMTSGDAAVRDSWWMATARTRDAFRANPDLIKAKKIISALAVGKGMITHAAARDAGFKSIDDFNQEADYWYDAWNEFEADVRREDTLDFMMIRAFEDMITVGNSFLVETENAANEIVPLAYQLIEWEMVAREFDRPGNENGGNRIQNGIRYDAKGNKAALLLYTEHPYSDLRAGYKIREIPWRRVIHLYMPLQISADSGMTWFYPLLKNVRNQQHYMECEMASANLASQLTIVGKSDQYRPNSVPGANPYVPDGGAIVRGQGYSDGPNLQIGQPTTVWVEKDGDVDVVESNRPNKDATPFLDQMDQKNAQGVGISVQRMTGDAAGANFASIKAAHEDDRTVMTPIQQHFVDHMLKKVRRRFTEMAVATRRIRSISADQFRRQSFRFSAIDVVPPGNPSAEPVKDIEAAKAAIGAGISSPQIECGKRGVWWKDVGRDIGEAKDFYAALGLAMDYSKGQGGQLEKSSNERVDPSESDDKENSDNARTQKK